MDIQLEKEVAEALNQYYDAEKNAQPVLISASIFLLAIAVVFLRQRLSFFSGMGWSILGGSLLIGLGALVYSFQVKSQKNAYAGLLRSDPINFCTQEMAHLNRMLDNFRKIIVTDLVIAVLGIGLYLLGTSQRREFMKGFGLGMMGMFLLLTLLENFNRQRGFRYWQKVVILQKHLAHERP